jgi:hypothetical protein
LSWAPAGVPPPPPPYAPFSLLPAASVPCVAPQPASATRGFGSVTIATHGASTVLEIAPLIMRRGKFGAGAANVENMLRCMLLRGAARSVRLRRRERGCVYGESEAP